MKALMGNLDSVIGEFSSLIAENRQRTRMSVPQSGISRLSMHSVDSREYFDADDGLEHADSHLFSIQNDEADDSETDEKELADSDTSSDIGDDQTSGQRFIENGAVPCWRLPEQVYRGGSLR